MVYKLGPGKKGAHIIRPLVPRLVITFSKPFPVKPDLCVGFELDMLKTAFNLMKNVQSFIELSRSEYKANKTKYFRLRRYDEVSLLSFSLIALWLPFKYALSQAKRWRLRASDKFVPDRQTDAQTTQRDTLSSCRSQKLFTGRRSKVL